VKRRTRILIGLAALGIASAAWLVWPAPAPDFESVRADYRPSDAMLLDRHGHVIDSIRIDMTVRRLAWQPLEEISPALVTAVVHSEDVRFWQHGGIDWRSVLGAVRDRYWRGRPRGASTITMQVASLLQSHVQAREGARGWRHKRNQIRLARALETRWSKQQILEAYLNLLHFRGELQGIAAASQVLAGKAPSGLTTAESLVLAALLPQPSAKPERVAARACVRARAAAATVACDELQVTADRLLNRRGTEPGMTHWAPQVAHSLLSAPGQRVQTTLDGSMQRLAREVLARQLSQLSRQNVRDGAVLVVNNDTGDVLAYVGSAGPNSRAAEVDGVRAPRQAGSTLKPFLFGLALERGYLTAASLLKDSPVHLDTATGAYIPQDYDRNYKGLVSVRTALGNSLNVPAVRALVLVGVEPFREQLYSLGYEHITESGDFYGYSLALGSAEVTLWQQAQAYRTLVRGGRWSPLRLQAAPRTEERELLSEAVSFIITDILSDPAARTLTFGVDNHLNTPFWSAAKTGTSKDMRDNWCIGFSSKYTVAVWVGNFEGDAMHDVSGVSGAAPVWRELMTALHRDVRSVPPSAPQTVTAAQVTFEGARESPRREWFLHGQQPESVATIRRAPLIPKIVSPANGVVIALDPDIPAEHQKLPISAAGTTSSMRLKLDGEPLVLAGDVMLWPLRSGEHRIQLEDATGKVLDTVRFTVR
jgi:penicillin-binding protein 1C